jgi:methyl-accepting chemotaxis protein
LFKIKQQESFNQKLLKGRTMLNQLTLSKKLSIGFGLVLILLMIVGFIGYRALHTTSNGFSAYRGLAQDTNLMNELQTNMLMLNTKVLAYLNTGSEQSLSEFHDYWQKNEEILTKANSQLENPERVKLLNNLHENFKAYDLAFNKVVELMEERSQLLDLMDPQGETMMKALNDLAEFAAKSWDTSTEHHTSLALKSYLISRIHAYQFLITGDSQSDQDLRDQFSTMEREFTLLDEMISDESIRKILDQARVAKNSYLANWEQLTKAIYTRDQILQKTLYAIGPLITERSAEIKTSVMRDQARLGENQRTLNHKTINWIIGTCCIATLLAIAIAFLTCRTILRQMGGEPTVVTNIAQQVAAGNLYVSVPKQGEADNSLYAAIRRMIEQLQEKAQLTEAIAQGDLTKKITLTSDNDILGQSLQQMVSSLSQTLGSIQVAGEQITSGSSHVADSSQSLSQGASAQASSLEEMSAATNQLVSQTMENADHANQANQLSNLAKTAAEQGNNQVMEMVDAMQEINDASQNISKIIKVIDEIAFQTNLLALNAAVEAARAGQHGKGFAVVAEEVRNLAARSAKAAEETATLIEGSVAKTTKGMDVAALTADALKTIVSEITRATDLIGDIATASQEQAEELAQINTGLGQIDTITQQNTANAEESAATAEQLSSQAVHLKNLLDQFTINIAPSTPLFTASNAPQNTLALASQHTGQ